MIRKALLALLMVSGSALAQEEVRVGGSEGAEIPLTSGRPYAHVLHNGRSVKVQRVQDTDYTVSGYWAQTVRKCPPFCIRPMSVDPKVSSVGEVEIFDFMEGPMRNGKGVLVDARTKSWNAKGTIPGAINIPFTVFGKEDGAIELDEALDLLGAKERDNVGNMTRSLEELGFLDGRGKTDRWDFSDAKEVLLWCNGPTCGQSPKAIEGLLKLGYPAEKIHYYRGGMQLWQLLALTTVQP